MAIRGFLPVANKLVYTNSQKHIDMNTINKEIKKLTIFMNQKYFEKRMNFPWLVSFFASKFLTSVFILYKLRCVTITQIQTVSSYSNDSAIFFFFCLAYNHTTCSCCVIIHCKCGPHLWTRESFLLSSDIIVCLKFHS